MPVGLIEIPGYVTGTWTIDPAHSYAGFAMDLSGEEWRRTGATLSDKTASSEFGLTHKEIIREHQGIH